MFYFVLFQCDKTIINETKCFRHVPKAKATTMAETPELKRIAENTKLQSNVKYHADFEKAKGKFTQVADDPETLRIKQNTKIIRYLLITSIIIDTILGCPKFLKGVVLIKKNQ